MFLSFISNSILVTSGGGGTGSSFASAISACSVNHIPTNVNINAAIPASVFKLILKLVSSFNSFAILL